MKKILTASAIAAAMMFSYSASAETGTVNFIGQVIDNGCDIVVAPTHNPATVSAAAIDLKMVDRASMGTTVGTIANKTPFSLTASNCPATVTKVSASFDYTPVVGNDAYLKNMETTDNGVGVQLFDDNNGGQGVVKGIETSPVTINVTDGSALLPFSAALVNTVGAGVSAGLVSANAQYTIIYQ
ncbi:fimbrial protein [Enterobacter hormaechei]|uniref:fimbrial protein n=1 Tax=Enterobacter hormaechei TaxID=158836 RepID=UPI000BB9A58A|nr:fimbrial protein [Enterobacter hormaechei]